MFHPGPAEHSMAGGLVVLAGNQAGPAGGALLRGRGPALDQVRDSAMKLIVFDDEEKPPAAVLATVAIWSGQRPLLVHVPENGIRMRAGRHTDLGVIAFGFSHPFQSDRHSGPSPSRRDLDCARLAKRPIPTPDFRARSRCRDLRPDPPARHSQRLDRKS